MPTRHSKPSNRPLRSSSRKREDINFRRFKPARRGFRGASNAKVVIIKDSGGQDLKVIIRFLDSKGPMEKTAWATAEGVLTKYVKYAAVQKLSHANPALAKIGNQTWRGTFRKTLHGNYVTFNRVSIRNLHAKKLSRKRYLVGVEKMSPIIRRTENNSLTSVVARMKPAKLPRKNNPLSLNFCLEPGGSTPEEIQNLLTSIERVSASIGVPLICKK